MKSKPSNVLVVMTLLAGVTLSARIFAQEQQRDHDQHPRYKLIDLGSFGGPASYINPTFTFGSPNQINRRGRVVGSASTSIPTTVVSNLFVCGGLDGSVPLVNHAFKWRAEDGLLDLGALAGPDNCSVATSINARGEVAGTSENGVVDPLLGANAVHAVLWTDNEIKDLGTVGGALSSGDAINNRGQVVGLSVNAVPDPFSMVYFGLAGSSQGTQTRAFLFENGVMKDLGTLGGPDALALFVNDRGQVAGISYTNASPNPDTGLPTIHPFLWDKERGIIDLGSLGGTLAGPLTFPAQKPASESGGFNNRGQFVNIATLPGNQMVHPFLWDGEKLIDLFAETVGGNPVSAAGINDAGEVVGGALFPNRTIDAYLWKHGTATDLGTVDSDDCSWARAINSRSQVVGQSFACDGSTLRAFLWENGSMLDLNKLIPRNSNVHLVDPLSINDRGEIAGIGVPGGCQLLDDASCGHAFVLVPCEDEHANEPGCREKGEDVPIALYNYAGSIKPVAAASDLTPSELRERVRAYVYGQNRRLMGLQHR